MGSRWGLPRVPPTCASHACTALASRLLLGSYAVCMGQGEVVKFAGAAAEAMRADGMNVLMEGRAPTLNYVRTVHWLMLPTATPSPSSYWFLEHRFPALSTRDAHLHWLFLCIAFPLLQRWVCTSSRDTAPPFRADFARSQ